MYSAAFLPGEIQERTGERRTNGKNRQRMFGREGCDAFLPVFERPVCLIWPHRRRNENDILEPRGPSTSPGKTKTSRPPMQCHPVRETIVTRALTVTAER